MTELDTKNPKNTEIHDCDVDMIKLFKVLS